MVRNPVVDGQFYESDFSKLNFQIEESFKSKKGPGSLPVSRDEKKKIRGVIVPHAGYYFSGPCAAWAYKEIAETHFPKTYILLGFS
ncbi:AmmeMemoRadiSam system protein B, partial [Candidatus Woesearchaeota archaeon]|nr:AmmeMemoRadiSam system protein B [Candidatus Woesearchaeota archaeon]